MRLQCSECCSSCVFYNIALQRYRAFEEALSCTKVSNKTHNAIQAEQVSTEGAGKYM